jgi:hypothetical protein
MIEQTQAFTLSEKVSGGLIALPIDLLGFFESKGIRKFCKSLLLGFRE